jgi:type III secretion protein J
MFAAGLALACSTPVATRLSADEADAATATLARAGIAADRRPLGDGSHSILVGVGDVERAHDALGKPGGVARSPTAAQLFEPRSVVPSRLSEQARLALGTAGDLERTLSALPGVLRARVHLALTERSPLAEPSGLPRPRASVLIVHEPNARPPDLEAVRALVAGAVPGLDASTVGVVIEIDSEVQPGQPLVRLGPLTVTHGARDVLRWVLGGFIGLQLGLLALVLVLWRKLRSTEANST